MISRRWRRGISFDAVTSTMALHHAGEKRPFFAQIFEVLKPGGVFVFGDHMGGATPRTDSLLVRERAWIKLGRVKPVPADKLAAEMEVVVKRGKMESNQCESVAPKSMDSAQLASAQLASAQLNSAQ